MERNPIVLAKRLSRVGRAAKRLVIDEGHARSTLSDSPVDQDGNPVPWITYPAAAYLDSLDLTNRRMFEYGAGASTMYWQSRVAELVSVENDAAWRDLVLPKVDPKVVSIRLATDPESYTGSVAEGAPWDVVVIDGYLREEAARKAVPCLAPGAIVVLDNTDWFPEPAAVLRDAGLLQLDFAGPGPTKAYQWVTSVFLSRDTDLRFRAERPVVKGGEPVPYPPIDGWPAQS
ncbi:MAG: hypothetical protein JOZ68_09750 [Acidimicrobiia bacterium]|nr:hypothetical protein [Acidimicrobiia bacterium]MBV8984695.1 hypothetical protein [Acidimicrobiia bacterium]MBV9041280.1 hypothetical protein [Acidimicrobiia bacterium]